MDGGVSMARVEDMLQKMIRRFDATDDHYNQLRGDLDIIVQEVDAHALSIKHLEVQISQLSTTVNPHQPGTLSRNTIQNSKNDGYCMKFNTRRGM